MTAQKSARFRAGRCCSPYPLHYRAAFAFSAFLYPQRPQPSFRSACRHSGSATGLPCSACVSDRIGPLSSAGGSTSMVAQYSEATPDRTPFWFKPVSTFGLFKDHDVNSRFTYVGRNRSSLAPHRLGAGSSRLASRPYAPITRWLRCLQSFTPSRCQLRMSG